MRTLAFGLCGGWAAAATAQEAPVRQDGDVVVTGQADAVAIPRLTTGLLDTPQAISRVDDEEMKRRGATTLTDAVRVVPGISLGAGETSWQGNNLILRGFTTRNDTFIDGMRDYGYYFRDPFASSAIEVLKGPASTLFGRGATGGVINQASRLPTLAAVDEVEVSAGTDATARATLDVGRRLSSTAAIRVEAMAHRSEVADRDGALSRRWGVAPTVAVGLGTPTTLSLGWFHQSERNRPDYGIPWFAGAPARVDRRSFYGFASDYLDTDVDIVTGRLHHEFSAAIAFNLQARWSHDRRAFRTSEAVIPAGLAAATPLSSIAVSRNEFSGTGDDRFAQAQADVTTRFRIGPATHTLVTGVEGGRELPKPVYIFHVGVVGTTLVAPPAQTYAETASYVRLRARAQADGVGVYALDSIDVGPRWSVVAGLRWDHVDTHYASTGFASTGAVAATTAIDRTDARATYRGALLYKPSRLTSVYLTYATSFDPSASGIESLVSAGRSVAQANLNAAPETGRIVELGAKAGLAGGRLLVTGALFDIVKDNVRVPDPTTPSVNVNGGRQRVRGGEVEITGSPLPGWTVRASYTYLDSATLATDSPGVAGSPRIGGDLPITPRHSGTIQIDRALGDRLSVGGGVLYQASRLGQDTNAVVLHAPGYAVLEARARFLVSHTLAVQANVYNLADALYYDQLHPFHVVPGAGRSALFTLIWKS